MGLFHKGKGAQKRGHSTPPSTGQTPRPSPPSDNRDLYSDPRNPSRQGTPESQGTRSRQGTPVRQSTPSRQTPQAPSYLEPQVRNIHNPYWQAAGSSSYGVQQPTSSRPQQSTSLNPAWQNLSLAPVAGPSSQQPAQSGRALPQIDSTAVPGQRWYCCQCQIIVKNPNETSWQECRNVRMVKGNVGPCKHPKCKDCKRARPDGKNPFTVQNTFSEAKLTGNKEQRPTFVVEGSEASRMPKKPRFGYGASPPKAKLAHRPTVVYTGKWVCCNKKGLPHPEGPNPDSTRTCINTVGRRGKLCGHPRCNPRPEEEQKNGPGCKPLFQR